MSDNIKVVVKVRPLISREIEEKLGYRWRVKNNTLTQLDLNGRETETSYTFDKVYDKGTKTDEVYNDIAKPIVEAAIAGFNGTIFAYGQTSSGKTFTMTGNDESPGIIPLAVLDLFDMIKKKKDRDFLVRVSYIEIYNETLKDLLNVLEKKEIRIRDTLQGVKVDCSEKVTGSPEEVLEAMKEGEANRQTGATNMNEESSRSHSIFQITIESREHVEDDDEESGSVNVSQLNLVDLAGSERAGQTGATGLRFKEGTHINKSLSSLALVIKQLSEEQKYTNYRDSKLTRILQNSLGGNAKTSIICAVTPASVEETVSTLQFANRAKSIKNKPEVNAVATDATMIQSLTKQLSRLQSELAAKRNLEVMLENKKHVEQELQNKIAQLQKMILNGFGQMPNRKPPPRRVTISAPLHRAREESQPPPQLPSFCTPGLKYNPLVMPMVDFSLIQSAQKNKLATVPEEGRMITPPPTASRVDTNEVIQIDSDDDVTTEAPCSPYHKCYDKSKTPPCVLRKNAKLAEKNLEEVLELTEREKIFSPSVVELIEKLEQNTSLITQLEEEISALKEQGKDKDTKIEELTAKINKTEEQIAAINKAKSELEAKCKANDITITEWEISYETLRKKSKTREEELLSLLHEQQNNSSSKPKKMETEMLNFFDMSKDISLVQSDNDSTSQEDGSSQVHELLNSVQAQLVAKHKSELQLEAEMNTYKQKIDTLETTTRQLQATIDESKHKFNNVESENSLLKSTIENLNTTIENQKQTLENQKQNLEAANRDMESYNSTIQELKIKLTAKDNILNKKINDSLLDTMIANEQKVIANNDNIMNIIHSLKVALVNKNKEINALKSTIENNTSNDALEKQLEIKERQINTLIQEAEKLKEQLGENIAMVNKLMQVEQELASQVKTVQEENEILQKQNQDIQEEKTTLHSQNDTLVEEAKKLHDQLGDNTATINKLIQEEQELARHIKTILEENKVLQKQNQEIQEENKTLHIQNDTLVEEAKKLNDQLGENTAIINKLVQEEQKLTSQVKTTKEENEILQRQNQDIQEENKTLHIQNDNLKEEAKKLEDQLGENTASLNKVMQEEQELARHVKTLLQENKILQKLNQDIQDENKTLHIQNNTLTEEEKKLKDQIGDNVAKLNILMQVEQELASQVETMKEENEILQKQNQDIQDGNNTLHVQNGTLIEEAKKLNDQLGDNTATINKLMQEEQELATQVKTMKEKNEILQKQNQDIQEENTTLHSQIADLQRQNSESEIQIQNLLSDCERLAKTTSEKEELLKHIDDLTDKSSGNEELFKQIKDMTHTINVLEKDLNDKIEDNRNLSHKLVERELSQETMSSNNRELSKQSDEMAQKIKHLERDLNEKDQIIHSSNDIAKANNDIITKAKKILQKIYDVLLQLDGNTLSETNNLAESNEDLTEILEMVDSSVDLLNGSAQQTLQNISHLEKEFSKLTLEKDSQISLIKEKLERSNSEITARSEQLMTELERVRSELESQEVFKLEEKLSVHVDLKAQEHLNTGHTILHKLHNITSKMKTDIATIPDSIDNFEELFMIFENELNVLESSVSQTMQNALEFHEKLLNLTENKESHEANLQSQIETINKEMEVQTKKISDQTKHLIEELNKTKDELENKTQEAVQLEIKLNDAKENNENLRNDLLSKDNSITLLHEKLKSLYSEIASLKSVNKDISALEDLLKQKYAQIKCLEGQLAGVVDSLEEKYQLVTNGLRDAIQNRDKLLVEILKKAARVARQCGVETDRNENADNVYEHVVLTLDKIGLNIEVLKTENDVERNDIEEMLTVAKEEIERLTELNMKLKEDFEDLYNDNQVLLLEIQRVKRLTFEELDTTEILEQLNLELQNKSSEIKTIEDKADKWKELFKAYKITMNDQMTKLVSENDYLKTLQKKHNFLADSSPMIERENPTNNSPQSLLTICCNKIIDVIQNQEIVDATTTSSTKFSIQSEDVQTQTITTCECNRLSAELSKAFEENLKLVDDLSEVTTNNLQLTNLLKELQTSNDYLLNEREEIRKEIQTLVEPARELHKKITNHRTNLSTLTATTYAENKLLHSQLKVLRHHHTRYTHVCQRDLPAFKSLLNDLMTVLKGSSFVDIDNSFKRYSLPSVLDNSASTFKNESTLDGDLLMLDTNLTMTTVNNTLVGPDQTCLDATQGHCDVDDTTCQADISKIIDPYLLYSQMETLSSDNQKLSEQIGKLEQENCNLTKELQKCSMPSIYKDAQCSPIKNHGMNDDSSVSSDIVCENCTKIEEKLHLVEENMSAKLNLQLEELRDLKAEKHSIQEKYNNLTLEMPSTEALVRKLRNIEKDNTEKHQEIKKFNDEIKKKTKLIKELQEENDTLSMQVMDNISESDLLKKELDELKETSHKLIKKCSDLEQITKENQSKTISEVCVECSVKDDLIKALQLERLKLNRSFSDSESSSTHNKICTLQSELHASKEDCKKITEEVATIKNQLERSDVSMCHAMDLDESMGDSYFLAKDLSHAEQQTTANIPDNQIRYEYTKDKMDCFHFYTNKIGTWKDGFDEKVKIIDVMTAFYNTIVAKHGNEVENLQNKLKDFEELKIQLETKLSHVKTEYSNMTKELQENQMNIKTVTDVLCKIKSNVDVLNREMSNVLDVDQHAKAVTLFKENLLKVIDTELGLSCVNIFDALLESIVNKHQNELSGIMEQYTELQSNMENMVAELNTVNENLKQMKCQLSERETEYNLLKAQKEKVHEINSAVTMDIVNKEKELSEMLVNSCHKLVELQIIEPYNVDSNLPFNVNMKLLFDQIINKCKNVSQNAKENQNFDLEINSLKTVLEQKEILLNTLQQKVLENEKDLQSHKSLHEDLGKKLEKTLEDNQIYLDTIEKITKEISVLQEEMQEKHKSSVNVDHLIEDNTQGSKNIVKECEFCNELSTKIEIWRQDYENLKTTNEMITKEKENSASELEKAQEIIAKNKTELDRMTSDILVLRETVSDNVSMIESLTLEAKSLIEQNMQLKKQFEEKNHECSRLAMNIKTHEKSAEIQSKIIIRLQKQKEEDDKASKEKDERLDEMIDKCAALHKECDMMKHELKTAREEVDSLKNKKDSLEAKVNELEMDLTQDKHKRKSIDAIADSSRRRRQSLYDSKRAVEELKCEEDKVEELFGSRAKPDDLFMDVDIEGSNHSSPTPSWLNRGRDSPCRLSRGQNSPPRLEADETSRPSSVNQTRRRRQSIHDQHRMRHSPQTHEIPQLITTNIDQSSGDGNDSVLTQLRDRLASTQQELEELKEKYRELDEECEICGQYLQERDEQCRKLRKEKTALEKQVAELNEKIKFNPKIYADVAVNTDKDWANLHSVVVDRMSFDAEVEKNKKLSRTIEELRCNKQDLKNTIDRMQKALEKNAAFMHSKELEATKAELAACKKEMADLQERYRELDDECETCAQYLRERDEQCRKLREAKRALEKKLEELVGDTSAVAASMRRKRQTAHDHNRSPQTDRSDQHTEISDDLLSQQVERDDNALKASNTQVQELQRVKMTLERVVREKAALESQLLASSARNPTLYVATGSAIVQSQQITDLMKENQKLKKQNAKLINLCKKRGRPHDSNRENEEPSDLG